MITRQDLIQAINECQNTPNPNANTCIKLAAFLTIQRELFGDTTPNDRAVVGDAPGRSFAPSPESVVEINGDSEFARLINGRRQTEIMPVLDELVGTVNIIHPGLYNALMDRLT